MKKSKNKPSTNNWPNIDEWVDLYQGSHLILSVFSHYPNARSYKKVQGTVNGLLNNTKYHTIFLSFKCINHACMEWLKTAEKFVYLEYVPNVSEVYEPRYILQSDPCDGVLFGFTNRDDAMICKLKFGGK